MFGKDHPLLRDVTFRAWRMTVPKLKGETDHKMGITSSFVGLHSIDIDANKVEIKPIQKLAGIVL